MKFPPKSAKDFWPSTVYDAVEKSVLAELPCSENKHSQSLTRQKVLDEALVVAKQSPHVSVRNEACSSI